MNHSTARFSFRLLILIAGLFNTAIAQTSFPYDTRSDSISIEHYNVYLDLRDFSTFILKGHTEISIEPLVNNISEIRLDLMGPTVDSVHDMNGNLLSFTAAPLGFKVNLGATFNIGDSTSIEVFYHGTTVQDPTFGGFYFNSAYAYNVGVSLDDIPHNYGKTWFPCFDNFITRSTYDLFVTTLPAHDAACGGVFQSTVINPDLSETHHWKVGQTIPSYLISVAVSNYVFVSDTFTNYQNNPVPVKLAAHASDTTPMKNSFANLENAFDIFEDKFGPYRWDRVGYVLVPMTAGAMEHAMNIAYPQVIADGSLSYQSIMAHELSHHWWGNLITCRTAEDMWINEGSAAYCEYVFKENLSNRAAYESAVRNEHKGLLQTCHMEDGGYWPLSGVPQEHTYGNTTYLKGADVIHTLRGYLGDSLFFNGLSELLEQNKFSDIDAIEYRDDLSAITGFNLNNFFADWIFQGGWPHVSIDSLSVVQNGIVYDVTVHLKQKLVGRTNYSNQIPVTLTLRDDSWNTFETTIHSSGMNNAVIVTVPFPPSLAYLNKDELISHAVTATYSTFTTTGTKNLSHSNMMLQIQSITDSAFVIVEHNWAAPDPIIHWELANVISPQRYWRIDGIWNSGFNTNATFRYSGQLTGGNAYLDHLLITGTEDSLILLYRPNRSVDWTEYPTYTKNLGNVTDKTGTLNATNVQKGEYAIGLKGQNLALNELDKNADVMLYPNPATHFVSVETAITSDRIVVSDVMGKFVDQHLNPGAKTDFNTSSWKKGTYWITGYKQDKQVFHKLLVVQ
ncbi:M1 family aminopeptidase [Fluviicola sp.]|uniref:M1 family aminopeptidase n=1 Tax=Fluviicola sp. TaxID=1917219 RepID=UPI003D27B6D7